MTTSNTNNNFNSSATLLDRLLERQEKFDNFMQYFSSPEMFGTELFNLHSMDASDEATRLLADCIEANWIIFGGQQQEHQQQQQVSINNGNDVSLNELTSNNGSEQTQKEELSED